MPLIRNGAEIENDWVFVVDENADLASMDRVTVSLGFYIKHAEALMQRNAPIGVRLTPADDPSTLLPYLDRITLIEISFPQYTDGRGYSQAQLLRRRYGYSGELRAVGHVLRDQILYMNRSGFDGFETTRARLSGIVEALSEYSAFYQPAADGNRSVFARRHEKD